LSEDPDDSQAANEPVGDDRRRIPRTDAILADPDVLRAGVGLRPATVREVARAATGRARRGEITPDAVVGEVRATLRRHRGAPEAVINATGILVHTNLGRSPLSPAATAAVTAACGYTDVEFDLATGARARRGRRAVAALHAAVPEARAVHIVNNNAAALIMVVAALAHHRDIIISRGELVEIGDGFRLPDLLRAAGARLREVGTTNRTTPADYAAAISGETGLILKVHPSNYVISGFVSSAGVADLVGLGVPVVVDIGSGLLEPHPLLPDEPDARTALRAGARIVTASGDKLLGGPQAGLILGAEDEVRRISGHPLARAVRPDKLTLAALEATLTGPTPPTPAALTTPVDALHERAVSIAGRLVESRIDAAVSRTEARVGGGGAPELALPSVAVTVPAGLARALRGGSPPVVGRVYRGRCLLDLRTVPPHRDDDLVGAVRTAAERPADDPRRSLDAEDDGSA
jgi:L-seryl-tRNA(Ser) seleniumtransferase